MRSQLATSITSRLTRLNPLTHPSAASLINSRCAGILLHNDHSFALSRFKSVLVMSTEPLITVTFIRHGESVDNLKDIWAGWKDAPLSNHGMNQARALGQSLSSSQTKFHYIHASDLKRAYSTAQAVYDAHPDPKPPFTKHASLREQHFGEAEGKKWVTHPEPGLTIDDHYALGVYPVLSGPHERFPNGESSIDLAQRADSAVDEILIPHIRHSIKHKQRGKHVAVVSHGLCISELIAALMRRQGRSGSGEIGNKYRGLMNTAWTRVVIDTTVDLGGEGNGAPEVEAEQNGDSGLAWPEGDIPPLIVRVTDVNRHEHIDTVKRQKGGIGSAAHDPKQQDIRAFFGGAAASGTSEKDGVTAPVEAKEHAESNVRDTTGLKN
ncbi:hypothetical protein JAAARDRAFT_30223 [Jaapia argillacea MUCL 33604]|uniref:Phosphoglycerate mutase-like protein n=1 Tax=Jaapia argillacea MUCL 33604 TaxID=933084 RepID=A0A067QFN0_9AGAM|nr:hypothetical protein JAAARDRAFT_30223 [Jaapia argillacea MUCL 33604]